MIIAAEIFHKILEIRGDISNETYQRLSYDNHYYIFFVLLRVVGTVCTFQYPLLHTETNENLIHMAKQYANECSKTFEHIEGTVESLSSNVFVTFDAAKFNQDPKGYIGEYKSFIDPIIKEIGETTEGVLGIYLTFNPDLTGEAHEIWYASQEGSQEFIQVEEDENYIEEFYPENEDEMVL